jgi:hypothetical protein
MGIYQLPAWLRSLFTLNQFSSQYRIIKAGMSITDRAEKATGASKRRE